MYPLPPTRISGRTWGALPLLADPGKAAGSVTGLVDLEFVFTGFSTDLAYGTGSLAGLKEAYGIEFGGVLGEMLHPAADTEYTLNVASTISTDSADTWALNFGAGTGINEGNLVITISGLSIPEPTTSTLSLLALVALAARRRRRK